MDKLTSASGREGGATTFKVRLVDSIFRVLFLLGLAVAWIMCVRALWEDWAGGREHTLATALLIVGVFGVTLGIILEWRRGARGERFLKL